MDITDDDELSYGRDSSRGGSGGSSSGDLEDIENELYSRIYYRSSEAIESTSVNDADASAQTAVDGATAAILTCPEINDEKANGDIVVVSDDDASEEVRPPRSCAGTEAAAGREAAATVDLTRELDEHSKQIELGDLSPDEYVVLSSVDEDDVVITSRSRPSHRTVAAPQPLDSSKGTIESDDDSDDHYVIDDSCNFEFNRLAQTPRSTTTFFGTLRDVLASLPPHSWRISDSDRYPDTFRSRYYNARCKRCNETGHAVRNCRKQVKPPACIQCGMRGHVQWSCKRQLCINCGQFGHVLSTCTLKHRKLLYCQRCHRRGHLDEVCSELWRQFHWVSKPEAYKSVSCKPPRPVGVNKVRYCANCGLRGHFLHDCKALQPNPFRPAPSVFVNVYRNDSARRGGTPNVKASRKAAMRDNIVSASAVRPLKRRSFTDTGLAGSDEDGCASPVSKKHGDGRLRTPTAAAPASESHLGRKQKRRLRVEPLDARRRTSSIASTSDVNAAEGRSPGTTAVNLAAGDSPNGDATAPARNAAVAAAELEAASSTAVPPWEQHSESSPGERLLSSPLKRPWLYDRSPAGMQSREASSDSSDFELLSAKRRHLADSHSTESNRRSFSASKTPGKKKSGLAAKSRSSCEKESGRTAELQLGGKKHVNPGKSPGGKQPGQAAKRKSSGQQPLPQRQHQQPRQQRQHQQPRQQQSVQQQQRRQKQQQQHWQQRQQQQRQHHQQQRQQQQRQQHRQQQLQQPQHQQRQHQNHQQQHQQHRPQQQQQSKHRQQQQQHDGSTSASGHRGSAAPREHYPSQGQQRKYWPTAEARGDGGRAQATSQSYRVVKHGDFTGHYYRSGSEMVVKFDY